MTETGISPPAASVRLNIMKKRADFLAAARAGRQATSSMLVQARNRRDGEDTVRVGFTCSKKLGNAVTRNRAKRRLRAVARQVLPGLACKGWDYVLIGRPGATVDLPFEVLQRDLTFALGKLHD